MAGGGMGMGRGGGGGGGGMRGGGGGNSGGSSEAAVSQGMQLAQMMIQSRMEHQRRHMLAIASLRQQQQLALAQKQPTSGLARRAGRKHGPGLASIDSDATPQTREMLLKQRRQKFENDRDQRRRERIAQRQKGSEGRGAAG